MTDPAQLAPGASPAPHAPDAEGAPSRPAPQPTRAAAAPLERIEALDVVRGFALLGIFLMNIEFFNRAHSTIGRGMPEGLSGLDWWASWFVAYFVQGKFWTVFSLLFGMGFAVMLTRAEASGRPFLSPYLRRILALAVFGAAHFVFLWAGDILFSYSVGALLLLLVLYGNWKWGLAVLLAAIGVGVATGAHGLFGVAATLGLIALMAMYLRDTTVWTLRGKAWPVFSVVFMGVGAVALIAGAVLFAVPAVPKGARFGALIGGSLALVLGWLSARGHADMTRRSLRLGVAAYVIPFLMMTLGGATQYLSPRSPAAAGAASASAPASAAVTSTAAAPAASSASAAKAAASAAANEAKRKAERAKRRAEREAEVANEVRILTKGHYAEAVHMRAAEFPDKAMGDLGFGTILLGVFMLGAWFIRSGVMAQPAKHLELFRRLALFGLPIGIGLGLLGSLIAVRATPGLDGDGFQLAMGLSMLGNLPACLGYVGLVVWGMHQPRGAFLKLLAPAGQMALTNYLGASLIWAWLFFGYGLGWWGMPRAQQVVFVVVMFALHLAFSHWWMARFRYGPLEWAWRAFTYRQTPPLRR